MRILIFISMIVFSASSCKKCYECSDASVAGGASSEKPVKYCSGSYEYGQIKNGQTITDYNGQVLHCY